MPDLDWWINTSWYDNEGADWQESDTMFGIEETEAIQIKGVDSMWKPVQLKPGKIVMAPWLLMHRSNLDVQWRDVYGPVTEYVDFNKRLRAKYPNGSAYSKPIYIRAHYPGKWDS